jgi:DNA repair protein RecN (Recombination protein N)
LTPAVLLHIQIRDFAIIDAAELELASGLTVLTGETGAGKSILVDAPAARRGWSRRRGGRAAWRGPR